MQILIKQRPISQSTSVCVFGRYPRRRTVFGDSGEEQQWWRENEPSNCNCWIVCILKGNSDCLNASVTTLHESKRKLEADTHIVCRLQIFFLIIEQEVTHTYSFENTTRTTHEVKYSYSLRHVYIASETKSEYIWKVSVYINSKAT